MTIKLAEKLKGAYARKSNPSSMVCEIEDFSEAVKYEYGKRPKNLAPGFVAGSKRGGDRKLYIYEAPMLSHVQLIAPTGAGKTQTFVANQLMNATGNTSFIVLDPKGELLQNTREKLCRVYGEKNVRFINFQDPERTEMFFNPLENMTRHYMEAEGKSPEERKREEDAVWAELDTLMTFLFPEKFAGNSDLTWHYASIDIISAIIIGLMEDTRDVSFRGDSAGIRRKISPKEVTLKRVADILSCFTPESGIDNWGDMKFFASRPQSSLAKKKVMYVLRCEARSTKSCYLSTASSYLASIAPNKALTLTSRNSFNFDDIDSSPPFVLFIIVDFIDVTMKKWANLFIQHLLNAMVKKYSKTAKPLATPVVFLADEFNSLAPNELYPSIVSVSRGLNVYFCFIVQSISQLDAAYKESSNTIKENCIIKVFLSENSDANARCSSDELGKHTGLSVSDLLNCKFCAKPQDNVPPEKLLFGMQPGECYMRIKNKVVHSSFEFFYATPEYQEAGKFDISTVKPMVLYDEKNDEDEEEEMTEEDRVELARKLLEKRKEEILKRMRRESKEEDEE